MGLIDEQGSQALSRDIDGCDDGLIIPDALLRKAEGHQIDILLGGEDAQQTLIQHGIHESPHLIHNQFMDLVNPLPDADAQNLSLLADDQNVGQQDLAQHFADIVEYKFMRIIVVKKFVNFPGFV